MSMDLHRLTPCPPMGWNSYDSFAGFINEQRALENLKVFIERLQPSGYQYFVIDIGWFRHHELEGREFPGKKDAYIVLHDDYGRPVPSRNFFPRGIQYLAAACHEAGVKFGLHMMRGIPRSAVALNTSVLGTPYHAADIANRDDTCPWCPDNYGLDMSRPGAQAYYDSLVAMLADWGVDFIKYDDIVPSPPEIEAVVEAIAKCGRDMVLSLSPGNDHQPEGWPSYMKANMIRTTGDIWDTREHFGVAFDRWQKFMSKSEQLPRGCWLDMDMIPFGELQVWNAAADQQVGHILMNGMGSHRLCGLNSPQKRALITMRALGASPLFMGGNLPGTDEEAFALLTDPEMLSCNQNGVTGKLVTFTDWTSSWLTPNLTRPGSGWLGIFNRDGEHSRDVIADPANLGIAPESRLYDIWNRRDLGELQNAFPITLKPDDVLFVRYSNRLEKVHTSR